MAREPLRFTVSRRAASWIYQESKRKGKREDFSLHEGCEKEKKTGQIPLPSSPQKKKKEHRIHFHPIVGRRS